MRDRLAHQWPINITVGDSHHLPHPRPRPDIARHQRLSGTLPRDIIEYRLRLPQTEAAIFQHRHPSERVQGL